MDTVMEAAARALPSSLPPPSHDPPRVCDLLLEAVVRGHADAVWIDPRPPAEDHYDLVLERGGRVVALGEVDAVTGAAVIARLALIADLDLTRRGPSTARTAVASPTGRTELLVTVRPGRSLRAEIVAADGARGPRLAAQPVELAPGERVGSYRIVAHLGAGGMGRVYQVEHTTLGRAYALKVLHRNAAAADPEGPARFLREARAAARIKHPHIVDVFDFGYLGDGRPYLLMELLAGASLAERIADDRLEPRLAVAIARQLAAALAAAHDAGVVHADVSPSNVRVDADHHAKLVDFGLALLRGDPMRLSTDEPGDMVYGTPSYISPEQICGQIADERSDQYAFGAVLYELLTGAPPFEGATLRELCLQHVRAPVPRLASRCEAAPAELARTVERCLAKRADDRFGSMHEVAAALAAAEEAIVSRGWRRWIAARRAP